MTLYSIYEKPGATSGFDLVPAAIPERFSWFAVLLPPLYALAHGLWLTLLLWVAVTGALAYAATAIGGGAAFALYALFVFYLGLESPALRRDQLAGRGWVYRGEIIATAEDVAQRDYLRDRL